MSEMTWVARDRNSNFIQEWHVEPEINLDSQSSDYGKWYYPKQGLWPEGIALGRTWLASEFPVELDRGQKMQIHASAFENPSTIEFWVTRNRFGMDLVRVWPPGSDPQKIDGEWRESNYIAQSLSSSDSINVSTILRLKPGCKVKLTAGLPIEELSGYPDSLGSATVNPRARALQLGRRPRSVVPQMSSEMLQLGMARDCIKNQPSCLQKPKDDVCWLARDVNGHCHDRVYRFNDEPTVDSCGNCLRYISEKGMVDFWDLKEAPLQLQPGQCVKVNMSNKKILGNVILSSTGVVLGSDEYVLPWRR